MRSLTILLLGLILMTGCSKDDAKSPTQPQVASIELQATHTLIRGFAGEVFREKITATVHDEDGALVVGQLIHFSIQDSLPWKGAPDPASFDTVTNELGEIYVNYNVTLERSGDIIIKATCDDLFALITIRIDIPTEFPMFFFEVGDAVLTVPYNETRQTTVVTQLTDCYTGEAMTGELLHFSVDPPSMGVFDSDTATTDHNGRALRTFSSIANQYGFCDLIVAFGDSTAHVPIEIRRM